MTVQRGNPYGDEVHQKFLAVLQELEATIASC